MHVVYGSEIKKKYTLFTIAQCLLHLFTVIEVRIARCSRYQVSNKTQFTIARYDLNVVKASEVQVTHCLRKRSKTVGSSKQRIHCKYFTVASWKLHEVHVIVVRIERSSRQFCANCMYNLHLLYCSQERTSLSSWQRGAHVRAQRYTCIKEFSFSVALLNALH